MPKKKKRGFGSGSALLLTTILLFVVLSLVVSLSYVTVMEQQMSSKTKSSVGSFFKADSGVEWALNKISNISGDLAIGNASAFNDANIADGVACPEGFGCTLYFLDENGKVITTGATSKISDIKAVRAVGTQTTGDPTQRAIEAAVAGGTCPAGLTDTGYGYCIQTNRNSAQMKWLDASAYCAVTYSARLCTAGEWYTACANGKASAMIQAGTWEWTSDADYTYNAAGFNSAAGVLVFGDFGNPSPFACNTFSNAMTTDSDGFVRCCSDYKH